MEARAPLWPSKHATPPRGPEQATSVSISSQTWQDLRETGVQPLPQQGKDTGDHDGQQAGVGQNTRFACLGPGGEEDPHRCQPPSPDPPRASARLSLGQNPGAVPSTASRGRPYAAAQPLSSLPAVCLSPTGEDPLRNGCLCTRGPSKKGLWAW